MAEILHQLIGSLSHYLQGLYIPGGAGFLPSTVVSGKVACLIKGIAGIDFLHFFISQCLLHLFATNYFTEI